MTTNMHQSIRASNLGEIVNNIKHKRRRRKSTDVMSQIYPKTNKYNAIKVVIDGNTFASKKEGNHYCELKIRLKIGEIRNLQLQVPFVLLDGFYHRFQKKMVAKMKYIADFTYEEKYADGTWQLTAVDVKGVRTAVYNLKKKMFLHKYGNDYKLEEV